MTETTTSPRVESPAPPPPAERHPHSVGVQKERNNRLRAVRMADSFRISGEAIVITMHLETPDPNEGQDQYIHNLHDVRYDDVVDRSLSRITGTYRRDRVQVSGNHVAIYIRGSWIPRSIKLLPSPRSDGEKWIAEVDDFCEQVRTGVVAALTGRHRRFLMDPTLRSGSGLRSRIDDSDVPLAATWMPGMGVVASGGTVTNQPTPADLQEALWGLRNRARSVKAYERQWTFLGLGAAVLTIAVAISVFVLTGAPLSAVLVLVYGALAVGVAGFIMSINYSRFKELDLEIKDTLAKIDLQGVSSSAEKRAYRLFQYNSADLKQYYDQALRQRRTVFLLGILCIIAGFASVGAALSAILTGAVGGDLNEKIVVAALGAVGGILADFIAVIFLRMFSSIVQSSVDFHLRLVSTHHAHFGNVLLSSIKENKVRDATLQKLAVELGTRDLVPRGSEEAAAPADAKK